MMCAYMISEALELTGLYLPDFTTVSITWSG